MGSEQQEKGSLNSSFLVLNLGSNTVSLANSFMLSNPNPAPIPNPNPNANANLNLNSASDDEPGTPQDQNKKTKKSSIRDTDDPEWVPGKKMKRTPKHKPDTIATDTLTKTLEQQQKQEQLPVPIPGLGPSSPTPPQYLISLLGFFGWKVGFRPASRDYVYQSPTGMSYHSLLKAFETFLEGNSKYKEKPWLAKSATDCTSSMASKRPLVHKKNMASSIAEEPNFQKMEGGNQTVKRNNINISNDQTKKSAQTSRKPRSRSVRRSTRTVPSEKQKIRLKTKSKAEIKSGSVPKVVKRTNEKPGISSSKTTGDESKVEQKGDERGKAVCETGGLQFGDYHKAGVPRCILTARSQAENKIKNKPPTKLTIFSKLIEAGTLTENQPVMYVSEDNGGGTGTSILSGKVTRDGIFCDCCQETVTIQEFESHAGSNAKRPWENVFLASGKTLVNCLQDAWDLARRSEKLECVQGKEQCLGMYEEGDESDDTCGICADGGRLICCDGCPSTFHQECLNLEALPEGSWYCPYCRCQFCNSYDYRFKSSGSRFAQTIDPSTCKQCKRKYHQQCAWRNDKSESKLFCSRSCHKLAAQLSDLIGISNHTEGDFCWTLLKIRENLGEDSQRSLSSILEGNLKLSMGLSLLRECFLPLIDQRTSIDVISQAIFSRGSRYNRLNYEGFYTVVLQKSEEVISLALLRFHGTKMAEMPFVGTRPIYHRQGMCHRLLKGVEQMLLFLEVEKLVVPAIPDMVNTWTRTFSFGFLEPPLKEEIKNTSLVIFAETTLLQKAIFKAQPDKQDSICANYTEGYRENPELCRRTSQDAFSFAPNYLYSSGFPFFPVQEILQQGLLATNPTPTFQEQVHGSNSLEASGSMLSLGPPDTLQAFDEAVYGNMSFESLLRMAD